MYYRVIVNFNLLMLYLLHVESDLSTRTSECYQLLRREGDVSDVDRERSVVGVSCGSVRMDEKGRITI